MIGQYLVNGIVENKFSTLIIGFSPLKIANINNFIRIKKKFKKLV